MFLGTLTRATTVVFYSDGQDIFVASDGKMQNLGSLAKDLPTDGSKVFRFGDVVMGFAGIKSDVQSGCDAVNIAEKSLSKPVALTNALLEIESNCSNCLYQIFTRSNVEAMIKAVTNAALRLEMGFATIRSGFPEIRSLIFDTTTKSNRSCTIQVARQGGAGQQPAAVYLGAHRAIAPLYTSPRFWEQYGGQKGVQRLIIKEIEAEPEFVGYPIFGFHLHGTNIIQFDQMNGP